jgi:uncharacterized protein YbjT (DUF2867 family)
VIRLFPAFFGRLCAALVLATAAAAGPAAAAEHVLVFGGSGRLGSEVVKALAAAGHQVTVFARPTSKLDRVADAGVAVVEGDVMNEADVEAAFKSSRFTAAVDALARGDADVAFYETSMRHIAKWAAATGVKQVILHGSVGAGDSRAIYPQSRWEVMKPTLMAKDAAEKTLMTSGVPYTIIRNAVLRDLAPGAVDAAALTDDQSKFGAVTRTGLARLTAECLGNAACANKIFHAIDPGVAVPGG